MIKRKDCDFTRDPELIIDGEKITFHSSRRERKNFMYSRIEAADSFFSNKKRYMHFMIIDMIFILLIGIVFSVVVGRAKSVDEQGFRYYFSKKYFSTSPHINFNFEIKNISGETKMLEDVSVLFEIFDKKDQSIHSKEFLIPKQIYKTQEFYSIPIIFDKPEKGKYYAYVYFGKDKEKFLRISFTQNY